jgi:hypothetical protein
MKDDGADVPYVNLPPGMREAVLEILLSSDPADKRRIAELDTMCKKYGVSFEQLISESIERFIQKHQDEEDEEDEGEWWKES